MALISCPECGKKVSSQAKACPNCGFAIQEATNDLIRIKVDRDPACPSTFVRIFNIEGNELLAKVQGGSVAEIRSDKEIEIFFASTLSIIPMCFAKVSPKNGGKYRAVWGRGLFTTRIESCFRVDDINF